MKDIMTEITSKLWQKMSMNRQLNSFFEIIFTFIAILIFAYFSPDFVWIFLHNFYIVVAFFLIPASLAVLVAYLIKQKISLSFTVFLPLIALPILLVVWIMIYNIINGLWNISLENNYMSLFILCTDILNKLSFLEEIISAISLFIGMVSIFYLLFFILTYFKCKRLLNEKNLIYIILKLIGLILLILPSTYLLYLEMMSYHFSLFNLISLWLLLPFHLRARKACLPCLITLL
jgi:hypothetical protein